MPVPKIEAGQGTEGGIYSFIFYLMIPDQIFFPSFVWTHTLTSRRVLPHSLPISHPGSSVSYTYTPPYLDRWVSLPLTAVSDKEDWIIVYYKHQPSSIKILS